jgi:hypothetical protein
MFLSVSWVVLQVVDKGRLELVVGRSSKIRRIEYHLIFIYYKCLTIKSDIGFVLRDKSSQLALFPVIGIRGLDLDT